MGKILTPRDGFRKPPIEARVERLEAALSMLLGVHAISYRAFVQAFGGKEAGSGDDNSGSPATDEAGEAPGGSAGEGDPDPGQ